MSEVRKRIFQKFDPEIYLNLKDYYYYRGTPPGTNKQIERNLFIKKGAPQKDILAAKKKLLDGLEMTGSQSGKNTIEIVGRKYIASRETEALNPSMLSEGTLYETKLIMSSHIIPWFSRKRIEEIDQLGFTEYCEFKRKKGLNLVNHRKVFNHFLKWCVHQKYLKYRPELEIPKSSKKKRRERVVLTDSEIKRLFEVADKAILLYISMYLFMGMRNMEISKLRWDEIDLEKAALRINPNSNRTRKMRAIPINSFVLSLLKSRKEIITGEWVFPSRPPSKYPHFTKGSFRKGWARVLKQANIDRGITPHDMRATFETHMHKNNSFTDTQREKMAGAAIDVQKNIYVNMTVDDLRGLESSVQVKGLDDILKSKAETKKKKKIRDRIRDGSK